MKKLHYCAMLLLAFVLTSLKSVAQGAYKEGDKLLNVGIGLNSYYTSGIPLGASYEVGLTSDWSVGGNIDYLSSNDFGLKFTALYLGGRASYHVNDFLKIKSDKIDIYLGAVVGYRSFTWSDGYTGTSYTGYGSGVYVGGYIGGKYYFSDKIGGFLEFGAIGSTNARLGVAFKL